MLSLIFSSSLVCKDIRTYALTIYSSDQCSFGEYLSLLLIVTLKMWFEQCHRHDLSYFYQFFFIHYEWKCHQFFQVFWMEQMFILLVYRTAAVFNVSNYNHNVYYALIDRTVVPFAVMSIVFRIQYQLVDRLFNIYSGTNIWTRVRQSSVIAFDGVFPFSPYSMKH